MSTTARTAASTTAEPAAAPAAKKGPGPVKPAQRPAARPSGSAPVTKVPAGKAPASKVPASRSTRATVGAVPVRTGEEAWTAREIAEVEADLRSETERLRADVASADSALAQLLHSSSDGAGDDQADAGSKNLEREHEMAIVNNAKDMLLQSERALARLAAGTYGVCETCGDAIGKARLQVFPRATQCMPCKQKAERR
ncbi:MAG TPA: TraR/DksA C4-type zinc finger protein [Actinocrinis sp.]|nr:TraR/DksA C4-type zinc finger protein [Actinocrinis sp.]